MNNRWLIEYRNLLNGHEAVCPECGAHNMTYAYEVAKGSSNSGFGAVWCKNCFHGFILCRVLLVSEEARKHIVSSLPADLKFNSA